jgi:hypothetical protein
MGLLKGFREKLSVIRLQHRKIEKMSEKIARLKGEHFNTTTELFNLRLILAAEDGHRVYQVDLHRIALIIAVADQLPAVVESRIYMPSFSPAAIGHTRFKKDVDHELCQLEEIFITAPLRGQGIGLFLFRKTLSCIAALPQRFTIGGQWGVEDEEERAGLKKFLEAAGFEVTGDPGILLFHYSLSKVI